MENQNYIRIYTGSSIQAGLLEDRLKNTAINPILKNETESGRLAGFGPSVVDQIQVFVHKDEYEKAMQILSEVENELKNED